MFILTLTMLIINLFFDDADVGAVDDDNDGVFNDVGVVDVIHVVVLGRVVDCLQAARACRNWI